jgi:hypothetical protein
MAKKKERNTGLFIGLAAAALLLVAAIVGSRFMSQPPPPPPPVVPPPAEHSVTQVMRFTEGYYKASLDDDAKKLGAPPITVDAIGDPFKHVVELSSSRPIRAGESIETGHLRITAAVIKEWASSGAGQGFRADHLVLSITNRTDRPLAYRVDTKVSTPEKCRSKGSIAQNAIALDAGEKIERTECLYHKGETLTIQRVEVIELPKLSYYYVSRLDPGQIGIERRVAEGHQPKKTQPCAFIPVREIANGGWADVIDFYARHNCDEYSFYGGYKFRTVSGPLPAHQEGAGSPADGGAHD